MNLCNNKPPTPMTQIPWSRGITYSSKRPPETRRSLGLRLPKKPARCGLSLGIRNTWRGERVSIEAATSLSTFHTLYPFHRLQEFSQMSLHGTPGISQEHFLVKMWNFSKLFNVLYSEIFRHSRFCGKPWILLVKQIGECQSSFSS